VTDDDKALVERLRGDWPEILVEKHWMMDSDAIDKQREEAADRIEALSAENERLREALIQIARLRTDLRGDFSLGSHQSDIARAALGETK
jgi:hypothetical protein